MSNESHISSSIIYVKPNDMDRVVREISSSEHMEVTAISKEQGKIIVVIDTPSADLAEHHIQSIKRYEGVMSVALVYHHVESNESLDTLADS